jgi:DNA repair protein RecO (recombination protein O)
MPLVRDRCLCVRKVEYSETSQILTLFGQTHGLVSVIAKGAHRRTKAGSSKFDGGIDMLDVGHAVFTFDPGRELHTLTEWKLAEGNLPLHSNLRGMYLGLFAAELVSVLVELHDPHPELYTRLESTVAGLASDRREELFLAFHLDLLEQAGLLSDLSTCVQCGRVVESTEPVSFSPSRGGVVCSNCERSAPDRMRMNPRLLGLARSIRKLPRVNGVPQRLPMLTRLQTDPLNRLFAEQVRQTLGRPMRMPRYVLQDRPAGFALATL